MRNGLGARVRMKNRTRARTWQIASADIEKSPPKGARTLRVASENVDDSRPNGARALRIASANFKKSQPNGAPICKRCLRSDIMFMGNVAPKNGTDFEPRKRALFRARRLRYAWFNQIAASALMFLYCFARELALQRCEETH